MSAIQPRTKERRPTVGGSERAGYWKNPGLLATSSPGANAIFSAQASGGEIIKRRRDDHGPVLRDYIEQLSVYGLAEEQNRRTDSPAIFHMDLTRRTLSAKAGLARLMEDLRLSRFDQMMLALNNPRRRSAQVPVIMAVGVGCPFRQELDLA